ncbi:MAG TPA: type I methionyl aminopeptidase [Vicinamibacterales bacterium]|nr:type I methionyl aminopeptidase [Vicinamibacterales bacterium]
MSIKSEADWRGLRRAADVARETLDALEAHVRAGITTGELDHVASVVFKKRGARSAPALVYGFPGTVLISVNDEIVHGVPGTRELRGGDLVKLDVTVERNGYISDAARSVIIDKGSPAAAGLRACAMAAFDASLAVARAGNKVSDIGRVVEREVRGRGFTVVRGLSGHGVGRTIHEPPTVHNHYVPSRALLEEGMVLTIEPLISAGSADVVTDEDGWTLRTADGSLAAHHEHTLVITKGAPVLLTAA